MMSEKANGGWVLLRGLMREQAHWGDFLGLMQEAFPQDQIQCLDFPGNGALHAEQSLATVEQMVEHCRQSLKQAGMQPPYRVLAMSLGAMVTVAWANRYPQELRSVVLINTSLAPHHPFYWRLRPQNYPAIARFALFGNANTAQDLILRLTSQLAAQKNSVQIVSRWRKIAQQHPVSKANALRQLGAAMRYRAPFEAPAVPMLLLCGEGDQLVNPNCSRHLAHKWQCTLRAHPKAGHDLPLDDATWVVQQVSDWTATS